jgi:superfamily I DNA/RNA helicase
MDFPVKKKIPIFLIQQLLEDEEIVWEERRIFYVAVTRAKEDLKVYTMKSGRSEFLNEVIQHLTFQDL